MAKQVKPKPIEAKEEKVFNSEEIEQQAKENGDSDYAEVKEQIEEVKKVEPKSEHRSANEIYEFLCELLEDSLKLQNIEAQAGRTPTELAITSHQLLMCKNNIARALGK